jgi:hypothetical protein
MPELLGLKKPVNKGLAAALYARFSILAVRGFVPLKFAEVQ